MRLGGFSIPFRPGPAAAPMPPEEPTDIERVLLVHGTFSNTTPTDTASPGDVPVPWWVAGSPFCRQLDAALAKLGCQARTGAEEDVFAWTGANLESDRRKAAAALAARLEALEHDPRVKAYHLIAHSHGGNVVLHALRKFQPVRLRAVIFLGTPYFEFRDTKPRVTPRQVALAVYWLGFAGSAVWVRYDSGVAPWSLLITFVTCLALSWPRKAPPKTPALGFPFQLRPRRSPNYGSGQPFAFLFRADEVNNLFRHIAKMAKEPRETFDRLFSSEKEEKPPIRPVAAAPERPLYVELNQLPHARLLGTLWDKYSPPAIVPLPGQAPDPAGFLWTVLNTYPPLHLVALVALAAVYVLVIAPFFLFAIWRECWRAILRLFGWLLRRTLWTIGPRVTSQYLHSKTFGLDTGKFHRFQSLPPEMQAPQTLSADLEEKMRKLSGAAGGWAGATLSASLAEDETSDVRARFEKLLGDPSLAHTQYYQEPEIINAIASLIAKTSGNLLF